MTSKELLSRDFSLENNRALLVPLHMSHVEDLKDVALEPSLWEITLSAIDNEQDLQQYIAWALSERERGLSYPFLIIDKATGKTAGSTRYTNISHEHKRLEIGYTWIGTAFQGTGLNKACKFELLRFAFEKLKFNRVEFKTDALNQKSQQALLKIGAKQEGTLRTHSITARGRVRDSVYFSIIASEWQQVKEEIFN